ncbi:MAG: helix-turn-helix transcriptional regulator [Bacilli bacterium]|nr:helix-turn-helix transcriptional regulator [Bacilli bacterium]
MKIGSKIQELRKQRGLSQEDLAEILGVSRQAVYKWEQDISYPDTDKLVKLAKYFNISLDSLFENNNYQETEHVQHVTYVIRRYHYEYKSTKTLFGLPLIHINLGQGLYTSKGIISICNFAYGLFSFGIISAGLISFGVISLGLLLALGSFALGGISLGAVAIGLFTLGAVSIGLFSLGAFSVAKYVAIGDHAEGLIAIGKSYAQGTYSYSTGEYNPTEVKNLIDDKIPHFWRLFKELIKIFL